MKFIDALYKCEEITRNGTETYHLDDNTIVRTILDDFICEEVQMEELPRLIAYDDWEEYAPSDIHRVKKGKRYYYVDSTLVVREYVDARDSEDDSLYTAHNYFTNKEDAQHLANVFKRLSLIINTKRYDTERDIQEIIDYIDNEYPRLKRDIDNYNRKYIL